MNKINNKFPILWMDSKIYDRHNEINVERIDLNCNKISENEKDFRRSNMKNYASQLLKICSDNFIRYQFRYLIIECGCLECRNIYINNTWKEISQLYLIEELNSDIYHYILQFYCNF